MTNGNTNNDQPNPEAITMFAYRVVSDGGEVLGESNAWRSAWYMAEWYREIGISCTIQKN